MPQIDYRARLQPKNISANQNYNDVLGSNSPDNILYPLWKTQGVLFPYTPSLAMGYTASYDQTSFIHSIYGYNAYIRSYPKSIQLKTEFTAQSNEEALYLLAVIHFFKSVTKSYFGVNPYNKAGTPPPVLEFNYLGEYQFNKTPVVIKEVNFQFEANIDYVPVSTAGYSGNVILPVNSYNGWTYIPTHMSIDIELDNQYTPMQLRNEFNLDKFREGKLLNTNRGFI